ncbi:MAG TPA: YihY/virulence factor BrkB family protein [Tepidisphaeraceae bacterium]|nr:YihY/virulence factor BrkB family protein [Tepidisphaeraceae bacterium]
MAALRELPTAIRAVGAVPFLKRVWGEVGADNVFTLASALAYSWLFALFPFLIFLFTLIPLTLKDSHKEYVQAEVRSYIRQLPEKAAEPINEVVGELLGTEKQRERTQAGLLVIGVVLTVWSAAGGMSATMSALDAAYDVEKPRPFWKQRPMAVLLTVVVAILMIGILVMVPIGSVVVAVVNRYGEQLLAWANLDAKWLMPITAVWNIVRYSIGFVLMFAVLAILYTFAPNLKPRNKFRFLSPGAVFSVAVWILLGLVFRFYIDNFGKYEKTYGTVGGVAILLLFFYLDAVVLLIGAEINSEVDNIVRGHKGETEADPETPAAPDVAEDKSGTDPLPEQVAGASPNDETRNPNQ